MSVIHSSNTRGRDRRDQTVDGPVINEDHHENGHEHNNVQHGGNSISDGIRDGIGANGLDSVKGNGVDGGARRLLVDANDLVITHPSSSSVWVRGDLEHIRYTTSPGVAVQSLTVYLFRDGKELMPIAFQTLSPSSSPSQSQTEGEITYLLPWEFGRDEQTGNDNNDDEGEGGAGAYTLKVSWVSGISQLDTWSVAFTVADPLAFFPGIKQPSRWLWTSGETVDVRWDSGTSMHMHTCA